MEFKIYEDYKNSNMSILGLIPKTWRIVKLKYLCDINTGNKDTQDNNPNGKYPFYVRSKNILKIDTYSFDGEAILIPGDGDAGKIFHYVNGKFDYHQRVYNLHNFRNVNGKYLYYYLFETFSKKVEEGTAKSTVESLRLPMLQNFSICIPTPNEQENIVNFLDEKTYQIDNLITKNQKLIELLQEKRTSLINQVVTKGLDPDVPMKDSGIEWIGEIPEHWELQRLKFLISKNPQYGANCEPESNIEKYDYRYIRITDINENAKLNNSVVYLNKEDAKHFILNQDDILFARSGATVGKTYLYEDNDGKCCFAGYLIRYVLNKDLLIPKFLLYYTFSKTYSEWIKIVSTQATIQNVSAEKYNNLSIPLPNINEQMQIVNFLEKETSKIDKTIEKIQEKIDLLEEYKTSLIHHTVTGKIDVRDEI